MAPSERFHKLKNTGGRTQSGVRLRRDRARTSPPEDNTLLPVEAAIDMPGQEVVGPELESERKPIISVHGRDVEECELEQKDKAA
jgi:hypothetical protein